MTRYLTALLMTLPLAASAQSGTVHYSRAVKFEVTLPAGVPAEIRAQIPTARLTSMVLRFTPAGSLLTVAPSAGAAGTTMAATTVVGSAGGSAVVRVESAPAHAVDVNAPRGGMLMTRMSMGSSSRADHESLVGAHTDLATGAQAQSYEFMTRPFLVSGERLELAWKLTTEQSTFLSYPVIKATATHDGKAIEAWFTPQIPVPAGPGEYGGLPGLILTVTVDGGQTTYSATAVDLTTPVGAIALPTSGQKVTRAEYEKIVDQKLAELKQQAAGHRGERIP